MGGVDGRRSAPQTETRTHSVQLNPTVSDARVQTAPRNIVFCLHYRDLWSLEAVTDILMTGPTLLTVETFQAHTHSVCINECAILILL